MKFKIIAEAHEGVISCDKEVWGEIEAEDAHAAMKEFSNKEPRITYSEEWQQWVFNHCRKVWAE